MELSPEPEPVLNKMEQITSASVFLSAVILISISLVVVIAAIIAINNLIYYYWKDLGWSMFKFPDKVIFDNGEPRLVHEEVRKEPAIK